MVNVRDFRRNLSKYLKSKDEIVISSRGKVLGKFVPMCTQEPMCTQKTEPMCTQEKGPISLDGRKKYRGEMLTFAEFSRKVDPIKAVNVWKAL